MSRKALALCLLVLFVLSAILAFAGSQTTSSTNASSIIDQARKYLNDPTTHGGTQQSIWSDAEMLQWVNDGTMDIVARTHCLEDVEQETLITSTTAYALSDPFIVIKYVIYSSDFALEKGDLQTFGRTGAEAGPPTHWAQWENNVVIYPAPSSDENGETIDVYVVDRPADVASNAAVLVPAQYDKALVYYVTAQGWAKDGRTDLADKFTSLYLQELDRYRMDFSAQPEGKTE